MRFPFIPYGQLGYGQGNSGTGAPVSALISVHNAAIVFGCDDSGGVWIS